MKKLASRSNLLIGTIVARWPFIVIILLFQSFTSNSQSNNFSIRGSVKSISSGKIFLIPAIHDQKYYGKNFKTDSSNIYNGKFKIKRSKIDNVIYAYRFLIKSTNQNGATDFIFISPKDQFVQIDSVDEYIAPNIEYSLDQKEMRLQYNSWFEPFLKEVNATYEYADSIVERFGDQLPEYIKLEFEAKNEAIKNEADSLFDKYATEHPNSQVTLWKLIERYKSFGYTDEYYKIFNRLSTRLQKSSTGKIFLSDITKGKALAIGSLFPALNLEDAFGNIARIDKNIGSGYTLIDFWFSSCAPCRRQFPGYRDLFKKYKSSGFQIMGISVDEQSKLGAWKNTITRDSLNWVQYIDKSGTLSKKLGITSFPTNFLLNNNGIIIKKNITFSDLELLLEDDAINKVYDNVVKFDPE